MQYSFLYLLSILNPPLKRMELPFVKYSTSVQKIIIPLALTVITLGLMIPLYYHPFNYYYQASEQKIKIEEPPCDVFSGEWVWNPDAPYYTNRTCFAIYDHQNCMKFGKPDTDYLKWRWKPNGCELPVFNPFQFLDMVRNKSLAIVGDSVGRNQMYSLICLLSRVEYPEDISDDPDEAFKKYKYRSYNFTVATYWSPFLVSAKALEDVQGAFNLYLDEADVKWTSQIGGYDYVILNSGHWFTRVSVYFENNQRVGCNYCQLPNVTNFIPITYAYQSALRTALEAINNLENFKGVAILRTFAPSHFEGGAWNTGGDCKRTRPFRSNETVLEGLHLDQYRIQVEEFKAAVKRGKMKGKKFRLMDITQAMFLRPDGHPDKYWQYSQSATYYNDCVHWCLPGPIDSWADFLFHMFKMEEKLH